MLAKIDDQLLTNLNLHNLLQSHIVQSHDVVKLTFEHPLGYRFHHDNSNAQALYSVLIALRRGHDRTAGDGLCLWRTGSKALPLPGETLAHHAAHGASNASVSAWCRLAVDARSRSEIKRYHHQAYSQERHTNAKDLVRWCDNFANRGEDLAICTLNSVPRSIWASNGDFDTTLRWIIQSEEYQYQMHCPVILSVVNGGLTNEEFTSSSVVSALYIRCSDGITKTYGPVSYATVTLDHPEDGPENDVIVQDEVVFSLEEALQVCAVLCPTTPPYYMRYVPSHYEGNTIDAESWATWVTYVQQTSTYDISNSDCRIMWVQDTSEDT